MSEFKFVITSCCDSGEYIYAIQRDSNKILKINKIGFKLEKIIEVSGEKSFFQRAEEEQLIIFGEKLFVFFYYSENYYIFDLKSDQMIFFGKLPSEYHIAHEAIFLSINKIIMLTGWQTPTMEIDCESFDISVKQSEAVPNIYMSRCCEYDDGIVYSVDRFKNVVYKYDVEKNVIETIEIGDTGDIYWGIKKIENNFFLIHLNKPYITVWNEKDGIISCIKDVPDCFKSKKGMAWVEAFVHGGYLYLFPKYANMILRIDTKSNTVCQKFAEMREDKIDVDIPRLQVFGSLCRNKGTIIGFDSEKIQWIEFDLENELIKKHPFIIDYEVSYSRMYFSNMDSAADVFYERDCMSLEGFLSSINPK